jgi:hypothetical protein
MKYTARLRRQIMSDDNKPKSKRSVKVEPEALKIPELTDDAWLSTYCSNILNLLPYKTAFKRDAIAYRRLGDALPKFRKPGKKVIAECLRWGENGLFMAALMRIVRAAHPMHWLVCDGCFGHGEDPADRTKKCNKCFGAGYKLKFEDT